MGRRCSSTRVPTRMLQVRPSCDDVCAAPHVRLAVASHLAMYNFTLKTEPPSRFDPRRAEPIPEKLDLRSLREHDAKAWQEGVVYARAQNLARTVRVVATHFQ